MTKDFEDELAYLNVLCSLTMMTKHVYDDYYGREIIPVRSKKENLEKLLSRQAAMLLPLVQTERIFVAWRQDLDEGKLNLSVLREDPYFQRVYNEKFAEKIRKPLDVIPDENLQMVLHAVISKYAHRNFLAARYIIDGLNNVENKLIEMKQKIGNAIYKLNQEKYFGEIEPLLQQLLEKEVELTVCTVYENGKIRTLEESKQFKVNINLTAKDFYDLSGAFSKTQRKTLSVEENAFHGNLIRECLEFDLRDFGQALNHFYENFDKVSKGTPYEKFTKDQKGSLRDFLDEAIEIQSNFFEFVNGGPEDSEEVQWSRVSFAAIKCMSDACDNCNFGKRTLRTSKENVGILLNNFNMSKDISAEDREKFDRNGGFNVMYAELLLTCMETMGQIIQNEKDNDKAFFDKLSSQGHVKKILDDLNEDEDITCRKFLATIRNSIVHGKYVLIPNCDCKVSVEFYDEKKETEEEKQKKKEQKKENRKNGNKAQLPKPKKYESKFFLSLKEIEDVLQEGVELLEESSQLKNERERKL